MAVVNWKLMEMRETMLDLICGRLLELNVEIAAEKK